MNHKGTILIETDNLILKKFMIEDAKSMYDNWASDDEVTKYLTWKSHKDVKETEDILNIWIKSYEEDNFYQWNIVSKEDTNKSIGTISIVRQDDDIDMVHVGYCISKKHWGKGVTSEALKGLIKFFFEEVNANRIESRHDPNNPASGKVMIKNNMKYEGTIRQGDINNQGICDYSMYGILKDDYIK